MNNLNELAKKYHERARAKGFWDEPRETGTLLMLMVSELSEALEADRKNKHADLSKMQPDVERLTEIFKNSHAQDLISADEPFKQAFEDNVKYTFEDEIADVFIRLFDFIGQRNIDIEKHIELKMQYNLTREYKHGKAY